MSILDKLKQIEGDTFTSQVVNEAYLNPESIERTEIQFAKSLSKWLRLTTKRTVCRQQHQVTPGANTVPKDKQVALSLLKVITQIRLGDNLTDEQMEAAHKAAKLLLSSDLSPTQAEKRDQYISRIGIEVMTVTLLT